ncbi:MAG: hypothetical protein WEB30_08215 [Cyclobacteriaceae bacterium]
MSFLANDDLIFAGFRLQEYAPPADKKFAGMRKGILLLRKLSPSIVWKEKENETMG